MHREWQLQEAKGNFSPLIKRAARGDAHVVTVHDKPTGVVVSAEEFTRLIRRWGKVSAALLHPDLAAEYLDISRSHDTGRNIEL